MCWFTLPLVKSLLQRVEQIKVEAANDKSGALTEFEFQLHNMLYGATRNMKLKEILHELHGISARFWHYWVFSQQEVLDQFKDHKETVDALERRDAKGARELAVAHIQNFTSKIANKIL